MKLLDPVHVRHLRITTCSNRSDDAIETAIGSIVNDPASMVVLVNLFNPGLELSPCIESVLLPQLPDLTKNLLSVRIPSCPMHRRVESEHGGMDLQARCGVHILYSQGLVFVSLPSLLDT
jgi:hypothetical protein